MKSTYSDISRSSDLSQKLLQTVLEKSQSKLYQLQGAIDNKIIDDAWSSFGFYLRNQLKCGRSITVPKFGKFCFSSPFVTLTGVTNPESRDKQPREPVFLVNPDLNKGIQLSNGIYTDFGIRPFSIKGLNGNIQCTKCNYSEIASFCGIEKDLVKLACERVFKQIGEKIKNREELMMEIPNIGTIIERNFVVVVHFLDNLKEELKTIISKPMTERKQLRNSDLTSENLKNLQDEYPLEIDSTARNWLKTNLNIDYDTIFENKGLFRKMQMNNEINLNSINEKPEILRRGVTMKDYRGHSLTKKNPLSKTMDIIIDHNHEDNIQKKNINQGEGLNYIVELVKKGLLNFEELIKQNNFDNNKQNIESNELKSYLQNLIPDCNKNNIIIMVDEICEGKSFIEIIKLKEILNKAEEKSEKSWISKTMKNLSNYPIKILKEEFEKNDKYLTGKLETSLFKACLMKMKINLDIFEITKLCRFLEREKIIDYLVFINKLETIKSSQFDLIYFAKQIIIFLRENNLKNNDFMCFIQKMDPKFKESQIEISKFALLLQKSIFLSKEISEIENFAKICDIDNDGYINSIDLEIFLKRNQFLNLDSAFQKPQTQSIFSQKNPTIDKTLFPIKPVNEKTIDSILTGIRKAFTDRKITFMEGFRALDSNSDGFITINEILEGLDKFVKFSEEMKEGFFAYLDNMRIGMVDYPRFLTVMKKQPSEKLQAEFEDNWDWQSDVIYKLKNWFLTQKISIEDGFKIMDSDFDSYIGKQDLKNFLLNVLKMSDEEITSPRIDRLFKLLDHYKRGFINITDFLRIFNKNDDKNNLLINIQNTPEKQKTVASFFSKSESKVSPQTDPNEFHWCKNAKQQLGLIISRNYTSVFQSFEIISNSSTRIVYSQFKNWIENHQILIGFNLTERLLQQLFSYLDPHKKGFITIHDWENAFSDCNSNSEQFKEIQETLNYNFNNIGMAFRFFCKNGENFIDFQSFEEGINSLLPNRFKKNSFINIWNQICEENNVLKFDKFSQLFNSKQFKSIENNSAKKFSNTNRTKFNLSFYEIKNNGQIQSTHEKLKKFLKTSEFDLEILFKEHDKTGLGLITHLEFRAALRKLNIGLTNHEIDELITKTKKKDNFIDWKSFIHLIKPEMSETLIGARSKNRIEKIKENIYFFLISPKDAFFQFNKTQSGKMTFDEFHYFLIFLSQMKKESPPSFNIVRDLFDFIDIRKDGILDLHEWMQTFRKIEKDVIFDQSSEKSKNLMEWECSKEFEDTIMNLAKNRKALYDIFKKEDYNGMGIKTEKAKDIIKNHLDKNNLKIPDDGWFLLLKSVERYGYIDYKNLMNVFKDRMELLMKKSCFITKKTVNVLNKN